VSPDITARKPNDTVYVQTVSTIRRGKSWVPDSRELDNLGRLIKAARKSDPHAGYFVIPKKR
jgi:hypothetical protein